MSLAKEKEYAASTRAPKPTPRPTASKPTPRPTASKPTSTTSASKPQSVASKMMAQRDSRDSERARKEKMLSAQGGGSGGISGIRQQKQQQITAPPPIGTVAAPLDSATLAKQQENDDIARAMMGELRLPPGALNIDVARFMPPVGMGGSPELVRKQLMDQSYMDPSEVDAAMMFGYPMLPEFAADRSTPIMANQAEVDAAMMNGFDMGPPQFAAPYMGGKEMQSGPARMTKEGPIRMLNGVVLTGPDTYEPPPVDRELAAQGGLYDASTGLLGSGGGPDARSPDSFQYASPYVAPIAGAGAAATQPFDEALSYGDMQYGGPRSPFQLPTYDFRDLGAMEEATLATRETPVEPDPVLAPSVSPRPTANPMASYPLSPPPPPPEYIPLPGESPASFDRRTSLFDYMQATGMETGLDIPYDRLIGAGSGFTPGASSPLPETPALPGRPFVAERRVPVERPSPGGNIPPSAPLPPSVPDGGAAEAVPTMRPVPRPDIASAVPAPAAPSFAPERSQFPTPRPGAAPVVVDGVVEQMLPYIEGIVPVDAEDSVVAPVAAPTDIVPQITRSTDLVPTTATEGVPDSSLGLGIRAVGAALGGFGEQFGEFISNFGRGNEYNPMTTDAQGRPSYQPKRPSRDRGGRDDDAAPSTDVPSEAPPWWPPGMPWPPVPPQATPTPTPAPPPYGAPLLPVDGGMAPYYQSYGDLSRAAGLVGMKEGGMVRPSMTNAFTPGSYYAAYDPFKRGVGGM